MQKLSSTLRTAPSVVEHRSSFASRSRFMDRSTVLPIAELYVTITLASIGVCMSRLMITAHFAVPSVR